jgi:hypothetical protein
VIFANFDLTAPSLEDSMGGLAACFDAVHDWDGVEWECWRYFPRNVQPGNWKMAADQSSGDAYHAFTTHLAMFELYAEQFAQGSRQGMTDTPAVVLFPGTGHSASAFTYGAAPTATATNPLGGRIGGYRMWPTLQATLDFQAVLYESTGVPNMMIADLLPLGPGHMEAVALGLMDKRASEADKDRLRKAALQIMQMGGTDDLLGFESLTQMAQGAMGRHQPMRYFNVRGSRPAPVDLGITECESDVGVSPDDGQWRFWLRWLDVMTADEERQRP